MTRFNSHTGGKWWLYVWWFAVVHHMPSSGELGRIRVDLLWSLWFNLFLQLRSRGEIHWKMAALHFSIPYQYSSYHCISGEWGCSFRI